MTDTLRNRLEAERADLLQALATTPPDRALDSGFLGTLADTHGAMAALDHTGAPNALLALADRLGRHEHVLVDVLDRLAGLERPDPASTEQPTGRRVVVVDTVGAPILIASYGLDGERIETPVLPARALALAEELLVAARQRLRKGDR